MQNMVSTRIENGKVAERGIRPDMRGMMQQLGVADHPVE